MGIVVLMPSPVLKSSLIDFDFSKCCITRQCKVHSVTSYASSVDIKNNDTVQGLR